MDVSPVDQAVITRALVAAADEMGVKLIRSAHSPVVSEAQDCSAAILDRDGRVVAQAELIPIQLGSITHTFKACLKYHPLDTLKDGDFLINNDPYKGVTVDNGRLILPRTHGMGVSLIDNDTSLR